VADREQRVGAILSEGCVILSPTPLLSRTSRCIRELGTASPKRDRCVEVVKGFVRVG
jgi:hypothetical protein